MEWIGSVTGIVIALSQAFVIIVILEFILNLILED